MSTLKSWVSRNMLDILVTELTSYRLMSSLNRQQRPANRFDMSVISEKFHWPIGGYSAVAAVLLEHQSSTALTR
jgi:hypothetical protein